MTDRPLGSPTWIDLSTHDSEGAKSFYTALFGWTYQDLGEQMGHYHFILAQDEPIGGLMSTAQIECPTGGEVPTEWGVCLDVPDVEAALSKAQGTGGVVFVPAMPVADQGIMAVVGDPAGATIGMWQSAQFPGFNLTKRPGTPVWFEAMSQDAQAAQPFYRDVFGWDIHPMGNGEYVTNAPQLSATAGLCDARGIIGEQVNSFWRVYFGVADVAKSLTAITDLGGKILAEPIDSPFGRLATVADPQGACFQIISVRD